MKILTKLLFIPLLLSLFSCTKDETPQPSPCVECDLQVWVDTMVSPGAWRDANDYWHVPYNGYNYFTIEARMDDIDDRYKINGVPLVAVDWDSDYWVMFDSIGFKFKLFSPFGYVTGDGTRIPVGDTVITLRVNSQPTNIIGYVHSPNRTGGVETRYSTYTRKPIMFTKELIGDTAIIYTKAVWNTDIGPRKEDFNHHCIIFEP